MRAFGAFVFTVIVYARGKSSAGIHNNVTGRHDFL
jgi:hypothetical protein